MLGVENVHGETSAVCRGQKVREHDGRFLGLQERSPSESCTHLEFSSRVATPSTSSSWVGQWLVVDRFHPGEFNERQRL